MACNFRPKLSQQLFRQRTRRHARRRLARPCPLQHIPRIMKIKLLRSRQVRVPRPRRHQLFQIRRANAAFRQSFHRQNLLPVCPVPVLDSNRDWRSNRLPAPHSRKNLRLVLLDLLPPAAPITQLPPVQLVIDKVHTDRQRRRQPRHKRQQRLPVRLPRRIKTQHPPPTSLHTQLPSETQTAKSCLSESTSVKPILTQNNCGPSALTEEH